MISVLRGEVCLLPRLGPLRVPFVQIGMMSIVNECMEVATGGSSTSVSGSLCRRAMDLEVTHGSPDVGIAPRKGKGRVRRIPQSESSESGDRDDGDESQPSLGMDSVGDHSHHPPASSSQGQSSGDGGHFESPMERARRQVKGLTKVGNNVQATLLHGNMYEVIESMRRQPVSKAVLRIPLCRMVHMPMVRPTLRCDVVKLMGAFRYGYKPHSGVIYVSVTDDEGHIRVVTQEDVQQWNPCWIQENDAFENCLKSDPDLVGLSGSMFFVYDGNHRLLAWKEVIETLHAEDQHWVSKNGNPECVVLDTAGGRGDILTAMHDINRYFIIDLILFFILLFGASQFMQSDMPIVQVQSNGACED